MTWETESAKFIAFSNPPAALDAAHLWSKAFGSPPQAYASPAPGTTTANGVFNDWRVIITSVPGRVELAFLQNEASKSPMVPVAPTPGSLPRFEEALAEGPGHLIKMVEGVGVVRVGLVTEHNQVCASQDEAIHSTCVDLGITPPRNGASDFAYQINLRADLITGLQMNRLARWGTAVIHYMAMMMAPFLSQPQQPQPLAAFHVRTLTLDVNSAAETPLTDQKALPAIWKALADETLALLSHGYARFN